MKFGLFGGAKRSADGPTTDSYGYRDFIDYVVLAEEIGFESVFVVEHHFTGLGQISSALGLHCFIAARTSRIRLGTAVVVLPWHNPALLAEQVATLDLLSGGRFEFGVGKGYRAEEFRWFCIPQEQATERFEEAMQFLKKAFTSEGRFSHHGKYWNFDDIIIEPRPVQRPHPRFWLGAGSPDSIRRAAREDWNLLLDQVGPTPLTIERIQTFKAERERVGAPYTADMVGLTRSLHIVANEKERVEALNARALALTKIGALRMPGVSATDPSSAPSFAEHYSAGELSGLVGTPDQIIARLKELEAGGVERVLLLEATGSKDALRTFAREIMPEFTRASAPAAATALA